MTEQEYAAMPGVRRSELWRIAKSPAHYRYYKEHPQPATPALLFGQAVHSAILTPDDYARGYAPAGMDRRTKAGREAYDALLASGVTPLSTEDAERITAIAAAVNACTTARRLLQGDHETAYFWTDGLTGEKCKCRTDAETDVSGQHIIVDIKTCPSAATDDFIRDMLRYGYDMQAAMYREGVKAITGAESTFVMIAVEKEPPHAVNVLECDHNVLLRGQDIYRLLLGVYHECAQTGYWYGYNGFSGAVNALELPAWLAKDYE